MERLSKPKDSLEKAREDLFHYMNSSEDYQDLTKHFDNLSKTSPEVYEIVILLYQELQTREKINKKKISKILYEQLNNKQNSIGIFGEVIGELDIIKRKVDSMEASKSLFNKLKDGLNWPNVWKSIILFLVIIGIFAGVKQFTPELYDVIVFGISEIFKKGT